ncbi:MAG: CHASE2 domain-containing protein, partial [Terriglobales bacterium]
METPSGLSAEDVPPLLTSAAFPPIPEIGRNAAGIGHLTPILDVDGAVRADALVIRYYDQYFPSMSLMLAAKSLNLAPKDVRIMLGEGLKLGNLNITTDPSLEMYTFFYKDEDGKPAFPVDSFYDVYSGKIPAEKYRDKIVLIGATAAGVGTTQVTPVSPGMAPVVTLAHSVSAILEEDFFVVPGWAYYAEIAVFLLVAGYLIGLLPRLKAGPAAGVTALLFVALLATHFILMTGQQMWLRLMVPATLLLVGHLLLTTKRFLVTERGKERSDAEAGASNRMLGLAFQGQGQLDMAFDYFRKSPADDTLLDNLYNLALDFERKRQFNKAESVFRYMAGHNPKFRDVGERISRAKQLSETTIFGGGQAHPGGTMLLGPGT